MQLYMALIHIFGLYRQRSYRVEEYMRMVYDRHCSVAAYRTVTRVAATRAPMTVSEVLVREAALGFPDLQSDATPLPDSAFLVQWLPDGQAQMRVASPVRLDLDGSACGCKHWVLAAWFGSRQPGKEY